MINFNIMFLYILKMVKTVETIATIRKMYNNAKRINKEYRYMIFCTYVHGFLLFFPIFYDLIFFNNLSSFCFFIFCSFLEFISTQTTSTSATRNNSWFARIYSTLTKNTFKHEDDVLLRQKLIIFSVFLMLRCQKKCRWIDCEWNFIDINCHLEFSLYE